MTINTDYAQYKALAERDKQTAPCVDFCTDLNKPLGDYVLQCKSYEALQKQDNSNEI